MSKLTYLELYKKHKLYRSDIYLLCEKNDAEIYGLFDEVVEELVKNLAINQQIPSEFVRDAKHFCAKDLLTNLYFTQISNRAFFLSDLIDFLALIKSRKT